jgi:hypothetical protein
MSTDPAQSFCAETFFARFRLFRWFALLFIVISWLLIVMA